MSRKPIRKDPGTSGKLNAQFMVAQARAAKAYYALHSLSETKDGKWELRFYVAGRPDDVDAVSPISTPALHRLMNCHFAADAGVHPRFESEVGSNLHIAHVVSKERAEELAHELMELFEARGISPMDDELQRYKPPSAAKAFPLAVSPLQDNPQNRMNAAKDNALRPVIRRNGWHFHF